MKILKIQEKIEVQFKKSKDYNKIIQNMINKMAIKTKIKLILLS